MLPGRDQCRTDKQLLVSSSPLWISRVVSSIWPRRQNMIKNEIYGKLKFKDLKLSNKQYNIKQNPKASISSCLLVHLGNQLLVDAT